MFRHALEQLGVNEQDYNRVVMVGNNLERDIAGANALGLITTWLDWSPRRSKVPQNALEVPDYVVRTPGEILGILTKIETENV